MVPVGLFANQNSKKNIRILSVQIIVNIYGRTDVSLFKCR